MDGDFFEIDTRKSSNNIFIPVYQLDSGNGDKAAGSCWNCGLEDHSIQNCVQPENGMIIDYNRTKHYTNIDEERQGKMQNQYKFKVGQLSSRLLNALQLPYGKLPNHIRKMRHHFGYPLGYLKDAVDNENTIKVCDNSNSPEVNCINFDPNMCPDFEGFNVEIPFFGPISIHHKHKRVIKNVKSNIKKFNKAASNNTSIYDSNSNSVSCDSSIGSLQSIHQEQNDNKAVTDKCTNLDENTDIEILEDPISSTTPETLQSVTVAISLFNKGIYSKLPNIDNFSKDMVELMNAENLPNATGNYEKLKKSIAKSKRDRVSL